MATYLSPSFSLEELTKSPTAIRMGFDNTPGPVYVNNLRNLCIHVLQPIRNYFALPVIVNSGFRSANLNRVMGGAQTSQHLYGMAADIEINGVSNDILWQYIHDNLIFDQLIAEHLVPNNPRAGWIHVSYNAAGNRKDAISCIASGKYVSGLHYVTGVESESD